MAYSSSPLVVKRMLPAPARAEVQAAHAEIQRIGCEMSNVLYNLAQKAGEPLEERDCDAMDKLRKEWDAEYRTLKATGQKVGAA